MSSVRAARSGSTPVPGSSGAPGTVRRAVTVHLLTVTGALILVTVLVAGASWVFARGEAFRMAGQTGLAVTDVVLEPLSEADLGPEATVDRAALTELFHPFLSSGVLYRVKVWRVEGDEAVVIYSDVPAVEGDRRPYDPELAARMAAQPTVVAMVPQTPEHRYENDQADRLLEVYRAFTDRVGTQLRLEVYVPASVAATTRVVLAHALPVSLAGLLVLSAATLPLAVRLARRVSRIEADRSELVRAALEASEAERTSLARWLHDGLVQHLATTGVIIDLVLGRADQLESADRRLLEQAHALADEDLTALRGKLGELAGPVVAATDLAGVVEALAAELTRTSEGVPAVTVQVPDDPELAPGTRALLLSVVAELLRNAVRHAAAETVTVRVDQGPGIVTILVSDDGQGWPVELTEEPGHAGLRLATAAVEAAGGRLRLLPGAAADGTGATALITLPRP